MLNNHPLFNNLNCQGKWFLTDINEPSLSNKKDV